jgi:hypothetical protein
MALNSWQKIDRVLPGQPFGDGKDGAYSTASIPVFVKLSCSGTAASSTLTASSTTFENGDVIKIHQTGGTGAGQWEINRVASGGGTTTLTLSSPLKYTYTDSGSSQAQAVEVFRYTTVTVPSGTWTIPAWDGNVGGLFSFAAKTSTTITGTIMASSKGGRAGQSGAQDGTPPMYSGEGSNGWRTGTSNTSEYYGGGGTGSDYQAGLGGGGANGTNGGTPTDAGQGNPGVAYGNAGLTSMLFGASGGGCTAGGDSSGGTGGAGGGMITIYTREITITGSIISAGASGVNISGGPGGGGAGGSILIEAGTATLGAGKITASGGARTKNDYTDYSGAGGSGRIHLDYFSSYTGTTTPTIDVSQDSSLVETGGAFIFNLI